MLLENKKAVIYGAGGAIGGVVARTFAREGAEVFLAGRTLASLDSVAKDRGGSMSRPGVILMMTTTPDRRGIPLVGPFGVVLASIEAFSHTLAAELGPRGIRVVCLRSTGSPESPGVQEAFAHHAEAAGGSPEEFRASLESSTMLRRLTTLDEVAAMAAFIASDRASATTGTAVNLTCGSVID